MIYRPADEDYDQFVGVVESGLEDSFLMRVLACLCIGLAISGIVTAFRGWSTHSDVNN